MQQPARFCYHFTCAALLGLTACVSAEEYFKRGLAEEDRGNIPGAVENYTAAVDKEPAFVKAYNNHALVLLKQNQPDAALVEIEKALAQKPDYAVGYVTRGNIYEAQNKADLALGDYARAVELAPDLGEARFNRGNLYLKQRRYADALPDLRKAHETLPTGTDVAVARATAEKNAGDPGAARKIFAELHAREPDNEVYERNLAETHLVIKDYAQAHDAYATLARRYGRTSYFFSAAIAAYGAQDFPKVEEHLGRVIERNPDESRAHYLLGLVYYKQNRKPEATRSLEEFLRTKTEDDPNGPRAEAMIKRLKGKSGGK